MLRGSKAARLLSSTSLSTVCPSLPSSLAEFSGGCPSLMLFVPCLPLIQGARPSQERLSCTPLAVARCSPTKASKPASCQGPLAAVTARLISVSTQRHLCAASHRSVGSSCRVFSTPKARAALPVQALEGPKRYAWRQKKWHKKIDKKRPNMPRREPLPPKHPARIIQSENLRESYLDRSRTIDAALVLEDEPEEGPDPWAELDGSAAARPAWEWRPVRQLPVSSEEAMSNNSDMQLVFFGTSAGRMSRFRSSPAIAYRKGKGNFLFDCGEDTQRQLLRQALVRPGKIDRIFITRRSAETCFGLPGMMCIISASREMGLDTSDMPLHIYGPPGLAQYLRSFLTLSDTYVVMPIVVHEFVKEAVPEEELMRPQQLERRACLFRQRIPPDQLNPQGYYEGQLVQLTKRHQQRQRRRKGPDERTIITGQRLPEPGDPNRTDVAEEDMVWTIRCDDLNTVTVFPLSGCSAAFGYVTRESDKAGSLNAAKCEELGVHGRYRTLLKAGETITTRAGLTVRPEEVIGATKFGRATAVLGGPAITANAARQIEGVDLLVHPASSNAEDEGCSHAGTAGAAAKQAGAKHLCITGFPATDVDILPIPVDYAEEQPEVAIQPAVRAQPVPRAVGRRHENATLNAQRLVRPEDALTKQALATAQKQFESSYVTAAHDLMVLSVERRPSEEADTASDRPAGSQEGFLPAEGPEEAAAHAAAFATEGDVVVGSATVSSAEGNGAAETATEAAAAGRSAPAQQRQVVDELQWDEVPEPQEAKL